VLAIREGRTIFRNLEKTIKTNLSSNIAELTCVLAGFGGTFVGMATPISALHILLIDMIGEMFPLIMLTYDPPEEEIMQSSPRNPSEKILTKSTIKGILFNGVVMGSASYGAFLAKYFYHPHSPHHYEKAMTVTFVSIVFCQYANLLSRRTYGPALSSYLFSNRNLWFAFGISFGLMLLIIYVPVFNRYFHTSALTLMDWLLPLTAGSFCLGVYEYRKKRKA
jgi:Ca2+-transporting ATPase